MMVMLAVWCVLRITYITITLHFIHAIGVVFWAYPHHMEHLLAALRVVHPALPHPAIGRRRTALNLGNPSVRQADFLQQKVLLFAGIFAIILLYMFTWKGAYKMAKIAVVEDNDAMREQLCGFIAQYARESGRQLDVTAFADGAKIVDPVPPRL